MLRFILITLAVGTALFLWQRNQLANLRSQIVETGIEFRKLKAFREVETGNVSSSQPSVSIEELVGVFESESEEDGMSLLERLTTLGPDEIINLHDAALAFTDLTERQRHDLAGMLIMILAESGRLGRAADLAAKSPAAEAALEHVFEVWGAQAPAAAQRWIDSAKKDGKIDDGFESDHISQALAKGLAANDPLQALRGKVDTGIANDVLQEIAKNLRGTPQYLEYAELVSRIPDVKSRALALRRLAANLTANLPVNGATQVLSELNLTKEDRTDVSVAYVSIQIDGQTSERATWLLSQKDSISLENAISPLIEKWTRADFNSVARWLGQLEPSPTRDQAVSTFAPLAAKEDPEAAFEWGLTISNAEMQLAALEKVSSQWLVEAPEASQRAILDSGLDEASKEALMGRLELGDR